MDSYQIASAIALRFSAANVTPPTGAEDVKVSTADLPENVTVLPTVLVMPFRVEEMGLSQQSRIARLVYPVVLFLARSDGSPRRAKAVHDWATALYRQLDAQLQLGLAYVAYAEVSSMDAGGMTYGGEEFDGIRFEVTVRITEAATLVA